MRISAAFTHKLHQISSVFGVDDEKQRLATLVRNAVGGGEVLSKSERSRLRDKIAAIDLTAAKDYSDVEVKDTSVDMGDDFAREQVQEFLSSQLKEALKTGRVQPATITENGKSKTLKAQEVIAKVVEDYTQDVLDALKEDDLHDAYEALENIQILDDVLAGGASLAKIAQAGSIEGSDGTDSGSDVGDDEEEEGSVAASEGGVSTTSPAGDEGEGSISGDSALDVTAFKGVLPGDGLSRLIKKVQDRKLIHQKVSEVVMNTRFVSAARVDETLSSATINEAKVQEIVNDLELSGFSDSTATTTDMALFAERCLQASEGKAVLDLHDAERLYHALTGVKYLSEDAMREALIKEKCVQYGIPEVYLQDLENIPVDAPEGIETAIGDIIAGVNDLPKKELYCMQNGKVIFYQNQEQIIKNIRKKVGASGGGLFGLKKEVNKQTRELLKAIGKNIAEKTVDRIENEFTQNPEKFDEFAKAQAFGSEEDFNAASKELREKRVKGELKSWDGWEENQSALLASAISCADGTKNIELPSLARCIHSERKLRNQYSGIPTAVAEVKGDPIKGGCYKLRKHLEKNEDQRENLEKIAIEHTCPRFNVDVDVDSDEKLEEAIERAVHDAALFISGDSMGTLLPGLDLGLPKPEVLAGKRDEARRNLDILLGDGAGSITEAETQVMTSKNRYYLAQGKLTQAEENYTRAIIRSDGIEEAKKDYKTALDKLKECAATYSNAEAQLQDLEKKVKDFEREVTAPGLAYLAIKEVIRPVVETRIKEDLYTKGTQEDKKAAPLTPNQESLDAEIRELEESDKALSAGWDELQAEAAKEENRDLGITDGLPFEKEEFARSVAVQKKVRRTQMMSQLMKKRSERANAKVDPFENRCNELLGVANKSRERLQTYINELKPLLEGAKAHVTTLEGDAKTAFEKFFTGLNETIESIENADLSAEIEGDVGVQAYSENIVNIQDALSDLRASQTNLNRLFVKYEQDESPLFNLSVVIGETGDGTEAAISLTQELGLFEDSRTELQNAHKAPAVYLGRGADFDARITQQKEAEDQLRGTLAIGEAKSATLEQLASVDYGRIDRYLQIAGTEGSALNKKVYQDAVKDRLEERFTEKDESLGEKSLDLSKLTYIGNEEALEAFFNWLDSKIVNQEGKALLVLKFGDNYDLSKRVHDHLDTKTQEDHLRQVRINTSSNQNTADRMGDEGVIELVEYVHDTPVTPTELDKKYCHYFNDRAMKLAIMHRIQKVNKDPRDVEYMDLCSLEFCKGASTDFIKTFYHVFTSNIGRDPKDHDASVNGYSFGLEAKMMQAMTDNHSDLLGAIAIVSQEFEDAVRADVREILDEVVDKYRLYFGSEGNKIEEILVRSIVDRDLERTTKKIQSQMRLMAEADPRRSETTNFRNQNTRLQQTTESVLTMGRVAHAFAGGRGFGSTTPQLRRTESSNSVGSDLSSTSGLPGDE